MTPGNVHPKMCKDIRVMIETWLPSETVDLKRR